VYASDELYLLAGRRLPAARAYDGYPHMFNGVGLTRYMQEQWRNVRGRVPARLARRRRVVWVSGRAAAGALRAIAAQLAGVENLSVQVHELGNTLFGDAVVVSGLLTGQDLLTVVREVEADVIVLPRGAFGTDGQRTLDDVPLAALQAGCSGELRLGSSAEDLLASVTS
jgi:NifB/MoaA-like Fe-S oxidoreductase